MEDTLNSLLLELEESKLLDTFCLLEGKKGVSQSSFLATVQAIHSQAKYKQPLVVDIDHESLWEQLNIVNRPLIRSFEKSVLRLMKKPMRSEALGEREKASAHPSRKTAEDYLEQEEHDEEQDYDEENDLNDEEIASDEDEEDENDLDKNQNQNQNQNNGDGSVAGESWVEAEANHSVGSEEGGMEAWLDEMEALDEKEQQRVEKELQQARTGGRLDDDDDEEQQDGNDNEDDADLLLGVQSALYDSGSDMDSDTDGAAAAGNFKFSDFFKTEKRARKPGRTSAEKNQQATALEEGEGEEEEESGEDEEEVEEEVEEEEEEGGAVSGRAGGKDRRELLKARQSSSQQQRGAAALRNQIESMESFLLQDKPWELRGEVAAKDRPQDSLLELAADIER